MRGGCEGGGEFEGVEGVERVGKMTFIRTESAGWKKELWRVWFRDKNGQERFLELPGDLDQDEREELGQAIIREVSRALGGRE